MRFSAYWHVPGNPKPSAGKHIECLKEDPPDLLFTEKKLDLPCEQVIMPYEEMPIHKFNLSDVPGETAYFKFRWAVKSDIFQRLRNIWCNKFFLMQIVAKMYPNEKYITWIDCVRRPLLEEISSKETDKICLSGVAGWPIRPFNRREVWPFRFNFQAGVIKIPTAKIDEFTNIYTSKLLEINKRTALYDEEYILIHMFADNNNLFEVINNRTLEYNDGRSIHSKTQIH